MPVSERDLGNPRKGPAWNLRHIIRYSSRCNSIPFPLTDAPGRAATVAQTTTAGSPPAGPRSTSSRARTDHRSTAPGGALVGAEPLPTA